MTKTAELRTQPFLDHYDAYKAWQEYETQIDNLAKLFHPDNQCYLFDTPWQKLVEDALQKTEPDLWEWYQWWLFEAAEGQENYEFQFEEPDGETWTYNTGAYSLQEFLLIVAQHYE